MIGECLMCFRTTHHLTLREMAGRLSISASALQRLEHGENPDGSTLSKVLVWMLQAGNCRASRSSSAHLGDKNV